MNASQRRIIHDALVIELRELEVKIDRQSYFIEAMWHHCKGKDSGTDGTFKIFNKQKDKQRLLKTRKAKVESAIKSIKSVK